MSYIQPPRIDATTSEGKIKQLEDFDFVLIETINNLESRILSLEAKEVNNG